MVFGSQEMFKTMSHAETDSDSESDTERDLVTEYPQEIIAKRTRTDRAKWYGCRSWDESRTAFAPSNVNPAASMVDVAGLHIEVSHGGHLGISLAYDTKIDERALQDIEEKVGQSLKDGSTGLMGFVEFMIMFEVLQQYHPGFVYNKSTGFPNPRMVVSGW